MKELNVKVDKTVTVEFIKKDLEDLSKILLMADYGIKNKGCMVYNFQYDYLRVIIDKFTEQILNA